MIDADAAILRLKKGNEIFRGGSSHIEVDAESRLDLLEQQNPFAIILGCSDSRVPLELIFAQGLGDLFVIRVAGNIAAPSQIGSIEFAAHQFGTKLVVVLGHSFCGAIIATIEQIRNSGDAASPSLQAIVNSIKPGIESCIDQEEDFDSKVAKAVRANVRATIARITSESEILRQKISDDGLKIVGAEYCLESGVVEFF